MKEWHSLFNPVILERGAEYYREGYVSAFNLVENGIEAEVEGNKNYKLSILLDGEDIIHMNCNCPFAESGNNCKHMAAVLFQMEETLSGEEVVIEKVLEEGNAKPSLQEMFDNKKQKAVELVNRISEAELREMLVKNLLNDDSLMNELELKYSSRVDAKQMSALKNEINEIIRNNSNRGFVDYYHAYGFTSELQHFLDTKVKLLIKRNALEQAFELTNIIFHCIGNIDMDDSDGGSGYVADDCYECWELILQKSDEEQKNKIKMWFESHQNGYVIDYMEEYLEEFLLSEFQTEDMIKENIKELDAIIDRCSGKNECANIYSVHYGYENAIIKRIEYMKMLNCPESEIMEFRMRNRHFFVIREMEIQEALEAHDYKKARQILIESKEMDAEYPKQIKKYSEQLIKLYEETDETDCFRDELIYYLENIYQTDLKYFILLKESEGSNEEWESTVERIISSNTNLYFVCDVLAEEKRYDELMDKIEKDDNIHLLDKYVNDLKAALPDRVIKMYESYVLAEVQRICDRNGYRHLVQYLKKISSCPDGKETALRIANRWRLEYKRRPAMMDELSKVGL